jgi:hypothetical protein
VIEVGKERSWTGRIGHGFADDRTFWKMTALVLGTVSLLKGARYPSRWSATQVLINYDFGLIKRGLFGATFGNWLHLEHYKRFSLVSYILLAVFIGLLVLFTFQAGVLKKLGSVEAVALFCGSCTLTFMAHLVGYMDIPLGILTVLLLLIRSSPVRMMAAVPVCLIGILIHESFLVVFFPCVLFSFVLDIVWVTEVIRRTTLWAFLSMLVLAVLSLTVGLALKTRLTQNQISALRIEGIKRADFPIREDVFDLLRHSTGQNIVSMKDHFLQPWMDLIYIEDKLIYGATIVLLLACVITLIKGTENKEHRRIVAGGAVLAACAPILMMFLGWDFARWDALCCLDCFLVLLTLCRVAPAPVPRLSGGYRNAVILTIALSMASSGGLMDNVQPNEFPFFDSAIAVCHAGMTSRRFW